MKKSILKFAGALALAVGLTASASAAYIKGSIEVDAQTVTATPQPLSTSTQLNFTNGYVSQGAGDLAQMVSAFPSLTLATWASPLVFNPFPAAGYTPVWTATKTTTNGVVTASFDLLTLNIVSQSNTFLELSGTGIMKLTGFQDTPGVFRISGDQAAQTFGFSSTANSLPEGGSAIALLGLALLGVEGARRRMKAVKA